MGEPRHISGNGSLSVGDLVASEARPAERILRDLVLNLADDPFQQPTGGVGAKSRASVIALIVQSQFSRRPRRRLVEQQPPAAEDRHLPDAK